MLSPIPRDILYMPDAFRPLPSLEDIDWAPDNRTDAHGLFVGSVRELLRKQKERCMILQQRRELATGQRHQTVIAPGASLSGAPAPAASRLGHPGGSPLGGPRPGAPSSSDSSSTAGYQAPPFLGRPPDPSKK